MFLSRCHRDQFSYLVVDKIFLLAFNFSFDEISLFQLSHVQSLEGLLHKISEPESYAIISNTLTFEWEKWVVNARISRGR